MSKRMSIFVVMALVAMLGFQIADFCAAPLSLGTWAKTQVGFRQVKSDLLKVYEDGGLSAVRELSSNVIEKNGVFFTVVIFEVAEGRGMNYWRGEEVVISAHFTPFEASVTKGVTYYKSEDLLAYANSMYAPSAQNFCVYTEPVGTYNFKLSWVEDKNNGNDM